MRTDARTLSRIYSKRIMRNSLKPLKQVEDHRARICLEMVCEFMRTKPEEACTRDVNLVEFQQWIGTKILSPNENQEYERYRRKYRERKKQTLEEKKQLLKDMRKKMKAKSY